MPISDAVSVIQQNIDVISHVELKFNESVCISMFGGVLNSIHHLPRIHLTWTSFWILQRMASC